MHAFVEIRHYGKNTSKHYAFYSTIPSSFAGLPELPDQSVQVTLHGGMGVTSQTALKGPFVGNQLLKRVGFYFICQHKKAIYGALWPVPISAILYRELPAMFDHLPQAFLDIRCWPGGISVADSLSGKRKPLLCI